MTPFPALAELIESGAASTTVDEAIQTRRSVRRFLPKPVPREVVEHILNIASRAPSGVNTQPWRVHAISGKNRDDLVEDLLEAYFNNPEDHRKEIDTSPSRLPEPYKTRQREVAWALFDSVGIRKGEKEKTHEFFARNYRFFDAPVGLIFTLDRELGIGSWMDYGMFLQSIMVSARGQGLHSCPQGAFCRFHKVLREHLPIPDSEVVVCGMSLGYADHSAPENGFESAREPVEAFAKFHGF